MRAFLVALLLLGLDPRPAAALPASSSEDELVAAVRRGEPGEIERVARRLGPKRLLRALTARARDLLYAALEAAPRAETAWMLLPRLGELMTSPDRPLAARAARAVARVTGRYGRDALIREEAPPDEMAHVAVTCAAAARRRELWADVRVHALECATALAGALGEDAPPSARGAAAALLEDGDAQIRRAAVELLAPPDSDETRRRLAELARDPDPSVAAAAVGGLCADDPRQALRLLGPNGPARAAELQKTPGLDAGTAATLEPCVTLGRRGRR